MHLKLKITSLLLISTFTGLFISCAEKEEIKYVAKVGDSYLTEDQLDKAFSSSQIDTNKYREAYIRHWIEEQLLYLAAKEKGILNSKEYLTIMEKSEKKTANSILINEIISASEVIRDSVSVIKYFENHSSEFKLPQPAIVYNFATFNNFEDADNFRESLFFNSWSDALSISKHVYESGEQIFSYIMEDSQDNYRTVYKSLHINQVSYVMVTSNKLYIVFQLLEKFDKNEIPVLRNIYDVVKERYIAMQRETIYKNYIKKLYSDYNKRIER